MTFRLVQVVATLDNGDGIGGIVFGLHAAAERLGIDAHICAQSIAQESLRRFEDAALERLTRHRDDAAAVATVFVYHYGIHNEPLDDFFAANVGLRRVFYFHNLTPARFFRGWDPAAHVILQHAHIELRKTLADPWVLTGDSGFNLAMLPPSAAHAVLPPVRPSAENASAKSVADEALRAKVHPHAPRLLFVGRFVPNKRQDVLLFALHALRRRGLTCELTLVGKGSGPYVRYLRGLTSLLGLRRQVRIEVGADAGTLAACYARASHFVVASEHEGFCVPVQEALSYGLVPIARPFGALREILEGADTLAADESYEAFFDTLERALRRAIADPERFVEEVHAVRAVLAGNLACYASPDELLRRLAEEGGVEARAMEAREREPRHAAPLPAHASEPALPSGDRPRSPYHCLDVVRARMIEPFLDSRARHLTSAVRRLVRRATGR